MRAVVLYALAGCAAGFSGLGWAQPVTVYSEFARIDGAGKVTAPETPREILSPALVRNGFNSFQVVVEVPAETKWWLFVGQNPENAVKVTMYKESGGGLNPAALEPVDLPLAGSGTQVFWMDLWVDGNAPVQRIKVEPEFYLNEDWVMYPIEGRVMEAKVPLGPALPLSPFDQDSTFWMHASVCGVPPEGVRHSVLDPEMPIVAGLRSRNVQQDVRLLDAHPQAKDDVRNLMGGCDAPIPSDPEWYLRIRDSLFRLR